MEEDKKPSSIKSFLARFKKLGTPNKKIKEKFINSVQDQYNITLQPDQVRVLNNHIYIRTTPIRKTEILKRKKEIISQLSEKFDLEYLDIS